MRIVVLNTLEMGLNTLDLLQTKLKVNTVIGLSPHKSTGSISGYINQDEYCARKSIDYIEVDDYTLKSESVKDRLLQQEIDLLVVCGWQRLIPPWLIDHCKVAAIGVHGSPWGITRGRGRSPQNWALLLGKKEFAISIFKIDSGIDSGDVIDTRKFQIDEFDDIRTLNRKTSFLVAQMVIDLVNRGNLILNIPLKQIEDAEYLPQRIPEDGEIDWFRPVTELRNFIRALSKPYPGAFSRMRNGKIFMWSATPFAIDFAYQKYDVGEIVHVFETGEILIRAGDGLVLVNEFSTTPPELSEQLEAGVVLASLDYKENIRAIIERHKIKHPNQTINAEIMEIIR